MGTVRLFNLACACKKLENFVYVSTCYVNSDKFGYVEEIIYETPLDPNETV